MDYYFSKRISSLQPSAIREILKATQDPSIIPFAAGNPDASSFPVDEIKKIYTLLHCEDKVDYFFGPNGHGFHEEQRYKAYEFLTKISSIKSVISEKNVTPPTLEQMQFLQKFVPTNLQLTTKNKLNKKLSLFILPLQLI